MKSSSSPRSSLVTAASTPRTSGESERRSSTRSENASTSASAPVVRCKSATTTRSMAASEIQRLWEEARQRGVDVLADNDAHTDFGPPLSHALPQWTQKLSPDELLAM